MAIPDHGRAEVEVEGIEGVFHVKWAREPAGQMTFKWHHPRMNEWNPHEKFRLLAELVRQLLEDSSDRG